MDCPGDGNVSYVARRWDAEYDSGRYEGEPPVQFVNTIIDTLRERGLAGGHGLYVGCGNGRNYVPLAAACQGLRGIDVSRTGLRRLLEKHPEHKGRVSCENFLDEKHNTATKPRDYLVSIQAFQHGDERTAQKYFERAAAMLRPGGLLFLRVNSAGTDVYHRHDVVEEKNAHGGFTVRYAEGPKAGLLVHFFTDRELKSTLHQVGFDVVHNPVEASESRPPPKTGKWKQWEMTAEKVRVRTS